MLSSRGYGLLWHDTGLTELNPAKQKLPLAQGTISDAAYANETFDNNLQRITNFAGEFSVSRTGSYAFQLDNAGARCGVEIDGQVVVNYNNKSLLLIEGWRCHLTIGNHTFRIDNSENPALFMRPAADETVLRSPVSQGIDYIVFVGNADEVMGSCRKLTEPTR